MLRTGGQADHDLPRPVVVGRASKDSFSADPARANVCRGDAGSGRGQWSRAAGVAVGDVGDFAVQVVAVIDAAGLLVVGFGGPSRSPPPRQTP